jgi:hypothetical protein
MRSPSPLDSYVRESHPASIAEEHGALRWSVVDVFDFFVFASDIVLAHAHSYQGAPRMNDNPRQRGRQIADAFRMDDDRSFPLSIELLAYWAALPIGDEGMVRR